MEWIILDRADEAGRRLEALRLTDGESRVLIEHDQAHGYRASLDPSGRLVAAVLAESAPAGRDTTRVALVDLERGAVRWLTASLDPEWHLHGVTFSLDGKRLVAEATLGAALLRQVFVFAFDPEHPLDSEAQTLLAGVGNPERLGLVSPVFAPGGQQIFYLRGCAGGLYQAVVLDVDVPGDSAAPLKVDAPSRRELVLTEPMRIAAEAGLSYCPASRMLYFSYILAGRQRLARKPLTGQPPRTFWRAHDKIESFAPDPDGAGAVYAADGQIWWADAEIDDVIALVEDAPGLGPDLVTCLRDGWVLYGTHDDFGAALHALHRPSRTHQEIWRGPGRIHGFVAVPDGEESAGRFAALPGGPLADYVPADDELAALARAQAAEEAARREAEARAAAEATAAREAAEAAAREAELQAVRARAEALAAEAMAAEDARRRAREAEEAEAIARRDAARMAREEKARLAAEAERLEEERVAREAEEARLAREAEEARIARAAEEERVAREAERARAAEEARIAREAEEERVAREAEAAREAERARAAEAARIAREAEEERIAREAERARAAEEARLAREAEEERVAREAEATREAEAAQAAEQSDASADASDADPVIAASAPAHGEAAPAADTAQPAEEARLAEARQWAEQRRARQAEAAARRATEEREAREAEAHRRHIEAQAAREAEEARREAERRARLAAEEARLAEELRAVRERRTSLPPAADSEPASAPPEAPTVADLREPAPEAHDIHQPDPELPAWTPDPEQRPETAHDFGETDLLPELDPRRPIEIRRPNLSAALVADAGSLGHVAAAGLLGMPLLYAIGALWTLGAVGLHAGWRSARWQGALVALISAAWWGWIASRGEPVSLPIAAGLAGASLVGALLAVFAHRR